MPKEGVVCWQPPSLSTRRDQ